MKKRIAALFWVSTLILAGCIFMEAKQSGGWIGAETIQTKEDNTIGINGQNDTDEAQKMALTGERQEGLYSYEQLNTEEKEVYSQIYIALVERQEIELLTTDEERMEKVFQCVLNDHPEIFYVEGYTFTKHTRGNKVTRLVFEAVYTMDEMQVQEKSDAVEKKVSEILAGMPADADEYGKVKYIYEYIIENTEYNVAAENNQNICSVFLNGQSVCQGYAKATQYLLLKAGIESNLVVGYVDGGEGHAWNLVKADGDYYYVDTTWGDASYRMTTEESYEVNNLPVINYDYLCVTTEQLEKTHTIQSVVPMPECVATENNYYVRERAYFAKVEEEQLTQVFEKSYNEGRDYVTLQCADEAVYQEMYDELITRQKIFLYMDTENQVVAYAENEEQLSLSFWLSE